MKRREFIKKASKGIAIGTVISGLPKLALAQEETKQTIKLYKTISYPTDGAFEYAIEFDKKVLANFDELSKRERVMTFTVIKHEIKNEDGVETTKKYTSTYQMNVKNVELVEDAYYLDYQIDKLIEGKDILGDDILSKGKAKYYYSSTTYVDYFHIFRKDDSFITLSGNDYNYDYDLGCFITTACTVSKGLGDNCFELKTLRAFRDTYMLNSKENKQLVQQYYHIAPQLIERINKAENKDEIYSYIYNNLIIPSLAFIEKNEDEKAKNYYATFVKGMQEKYALKISNS